MARVNGTTSTTGSRSTELVDIYAVARQEFLKYAESKLGKFLG